MTTRFKRQRAEGMPRPLSKQEIDRQIELVLADLAAAIDAAASGAEDAPRDPLGPRPLSAGALTSRMRKLITLN